MCKSTYMYTYTCSSSLAIPSGGQIDRTGRRNDKTKQEHVKFPHGKIYRTERFRNNEKVSQRWREKRDK